MEVALYGISVAWGGVRALGKMALMGAAAAGTVRVFPDADRVEQALLDQAELTAFVDASSALTFAQLVDLLCTGMPTRPVSGLTARVVLWGVAQAMGPGPFGTFVEEPAFARAALELFFDLKSGCATPGQFQIWARELPPLRQPRARFLAELYQAFDKRMAALALADREERVRFAIRELNTKGLPSRLARVEALQLQGVHDFPPLRLELVLALAEACERAQVALRVIVPGAGSPYVDAAVDDFFAVIEKRAQSLSSLEVFKEDAISEERPLARVGAALFSPVAAGAVPCSPELLTLESYSTAREEARQLARRVRRLVDEGATPDRIAVAYPELGPEAEWVVEALEDLDIPARSRRGAPVGSTAAGRLALSLPLLVEEAFPSRDVARILSSRYAPEVSRGAPEAPARIFAWASVRDEDMGGAQGKGAYAARLGALATRLENAEDRGASAVRALASRCERLFEVVRTLPENAPPLDHLGRWWNALETLGLPKAIRRREPRVNESSPLGRATLRALARDQAAFEALREMASELDGAFRMAAVARSMTRRTFHRWLADASADFNLETHGPRAGAVQVLDVRELWGRRLDHVLVGGVVDGRFPGRGGSHALFPDEDRAVINRLASRGIFKLSTGDLEGKVPPPLAQGRLMFYVALTSALETTTITCARKGPTGQDQGPSAFLDELARVAGRTLEAVPHAPVPSLDEVLTQGQLRMRVALEALAEPSLRLTSADPSRSLLERTFASEGWFQDAARTAGMEEERLTFFSREDRPPGPFSGQISDPKLAQPLQDLFRFGPERPLSASVLNRFGNCGFQGFLSYGLKLEELENAGEDLDPAGQGTFWHKVLELLFPKLQAQGLLGVSVADLPDELVDQTLAEAAADMERSGHVGHPALWRLGRDRARAMVRRVLGRELKGLPFDGHSPAHTELSFGKATSPERWRNVALPTDDGTPPIHLEGKIDRVDSAPGSLGLVDYKSSKVAPATVQADRLLETEFQLPLYLYAARRAGSPEVRAAWLSLKTGDALEMGEVLAQGLDQSLDELLSVDPAVRHKVREAGGKNLANAVQDKVRQWRAGEFPARPDECRFCAFQAVCRISDRRLVEGGDHG
jgi:ATP-dependent helicase/nuclease subunit B